MLKLLTFIATIAFFLLLTSCVSVKVIKPGRTLSPEDGYIGTVFANKKEIISFGSRYAYLTIRQKDSGRLFYLPFGSGNELRLVSVVPGNYQIEDFVYLSGIGSVKGQDAIKKKEKLLHRIPQYTGTKIVRASFPGSYTRTFMVEAGQIVYIGSYSWKSKLSFDEGAVTIERLFESEDTILSTIRKNHPNIPKSITFLSLIE